jgi:rSAM/selenodomain-associated transferase 1
VTVLLVVAKAPVPGAVKTRLCPPATPRQAARVAAAALLDTMDAVRATADATHVLACAGRLADAEGFAELADAVSGWPVLSQQGSGLADRLANAHAQVAAAYPGQPVLQIGMDTPQVTPDLLAAALHGLDAADAVLGRAVDGGWWLLGLRDPRHADALRGVPTSTAETGRRTCAALRSRGLRVAPAPPLRDVDEWSDALAVAAIAPGRRFARQVAAVRSDLAIGSAPDDRRDGTAGFPTAYAPPTS